MSFPIQKLQFKIARLSGEAKQAILEMSTEPFEFKGKRVEADFRVSGIALPSLDDIRLSGITIEPSLGSNSISKAGMFYFEDSYHLVDVFQIVFGEIEADRTPVSLKCRFYMQFEEKIEVIDHLIQSELGFASSIDFPGASTLHESDSSAQQGVHLLKSFSWTAGIFIVLIGIGSLILTVPFLLPALLMAFESPYAYFVLGSLLLVLISGFMLKRSSG